MGYKLEKCKACHRLYVVDTEELSSSCPHCKEAENLALLADSKWLSLDDQEKKLYSELKKLTKRIDTFASGVRPKKNGKKPWTLKEKLALVIPWLLLFVIFFGALIKNPDGWIILGSAVGLVVLFFGIFEVAKLIDKPKDRALLRELEQDCDQIYKEIAYIQKAKDSYRVEWLAARTSAKQVGEGA